MARNQRKYNTEYKVQAVKLKILFLPTLLPAKGIIKQSHEIFKGLSKIIKTGDRLRNRGINTGHKTPHLKILGTKKAPLKSGANAVYMTLKGAWRS